VVGAHFSAEEFGCLLPEPSLEAGRCLGPHASQVIASRDVLEANLEQLSGNNMPTSPPKRPPYWGLVFGLRPAVIEFWQGRSSRCNDA